MTSPLRIGSLCSGYGGLDMAVQQALGGSIAWHADNDPAAGRVLAHHWPGVPNHGDITSADWSAAEPVDVLTAGYPCQPDSAAGKRRGADDERWIWPAVRDAIRDLGPGLVVLENVRGHLGRGFPGVVGDLADLGYDVRWCCIPASAVGAPHRRERLFAVAWPADGDGPRRAALSLGASTAGRTERHDARRGGVPPAADPDRIGQPGWGAGPAGTPDQRRPGPRTETAGRGRTTADPDRDQLRQQPVAVAGRHGEAVPGLAGRTAAAHTGGQGLEVGRVEPDGPQRPAAERGGHEPLADPSSDGLVRDTGSARGSAARGSRERVAAGSDRRAPHADACGSGLAPRTAATQTRPAERGAAPDRDGDGPGRWARWAPAIERWERATRPAPDPVERGRRGNWRLNPAFSEWMMGLPAGWVTAVPGLTRNDQLRLIGNGVVPQQGAAALRWLVGDAALGGAA